MKLQACFNSLRVKRQLCFTANASFDPDASTAAALGKLGFQLGGFRNAFTRSVGFAQGVLRRSLQPWATIALH